MNRLLVFGIISVVLIIIDWYVYSGLKIAIAPLPVWAQRASKIFFFGLTVVTIFGFMFFEPLFKIKPRVLF